MIDTEKMRGLLARINDCTKPVDAADRSGVLQYIDALLAEVEAARKENESLMSALAECREAMPNRDSCDAELMQAVGDPGAVPIYVKTVVATLRAELEAAAADKRDAERYRFIKSKTKTFSLDMSGQHTYVIDFAIARLKGPSLDMAIDAALSQGDKS